MTGRRRLTVVLLLALLFLSALGTVYAKHQNRKLFVNLQALNSERDALDVEWGRLQLEQSTWATPGRVEALARKKLGMKIPDARRIVIVTP